MSHPYNKTKYCYGDVKPFDNWLNWRENRFVFNTKTRNFVPLTEALKTASFVVVEHCSKMGLENGRDYILNANEIRFKDRTNLAFFKMLWMNNND